MSYQFVLGFCLGAYTGTRYDLAPWVDCLETAARNAFSDIKERAPAPPTRVEERNTISDIKERAPAPTRVEEYLPETNNDRPWSSWFIREDNS